MPFSEPKYSVPPSSSGEDSVRLASSRHQLDLALLRVERDDPPDVGLRPLALALQQDDVDLAVAVGGGGGGERAEPLAPQGPARVLVDGEEDAVVVEEEEAGAADHRRELEQHVALVLPDLAVRRAERLLQRQVAAAVARVAVVGPDEPVDRVGLLLAGGVGLDLGRLGRRGGLGAELHVGVRDVVLVLRDDVGRGGAHQGDHRDAEDEHDPPPAPLALLRGHPGLGYCRAPRAPGPSGGRPLALAGEPGAWVVGGAVRDALLGRAAGDLDIVVEGDAIAVARRVAERLGGERAGARPLRDGDRARRRAPSSTWPPRGARPTRARAPCPRSRSARRWPRTSPGATSPSTRSRCRRRAARWRRGPARAPTSTPRVLRVLHPGSFLDDPTRLVRMARYAGRLGFAADEATAALAADAVAGGALRTVTGERLGAELRLLAREPQPAALRELARHGLGAALLPGFDVDEELVARAVALAEEVGARPDLVALAVGDGRRSAGRAAARAGVPRRGGGGDPGGLRRRRGAGRAAVGRRRRARGPAGRGRGAGGGARLGGSGGVAAPRSRRAAGDRRERPGRRRAARAGRGRGPPGRAGGAARRAGAGSGGAARGGAGGGGRGVARRIAPRRHARPLAVRRCAVYGGH